MESIHIYHSNDVHSDLHSWTNLQRLMARWRKTDHQAGISASLLFDLGDAIDYQHTLMEATRGQAMVQLMNDLGYDGATIGNNEGLNLSQSDLNRAYAGARYDLLIANLLDQKSQTPPPWAQAFKIYQTSAGSCLGVFGVTYPYTDTYALNQWQVLDPYKSIQKIVERYADQVDVLILLSHLGKDEDVKVAKNFPALDLILGSHTHHVFDQGCWVGDCLLTGGGARGKYMGRVELKLDNHRLVHKEACLYDLDKELNDYDLEQAQAWLLKGGQALDQIEVGQLPHLLKKNYFQESDLSQLAHQAFQDYAQEKVSVLMGGLFLKDLGPGRVSRKDLHDCLPHSMRLLKVRLRGQDLIRFLQSVENQRVHLRQLSVRGAGFRGEVLGDILYSGIHQDSQQNFYYLNRKIRPNKHYDLVTVDFMLFSSFFPILKERAQTDLLYPDLLRQVLENYIRQKR